MSSRNTYLSQEERKAALILHKSLMLGKEMAEQGEREATKIKAAIIRKIETEPLARVDYVEIVDPDTLEELERVEGEALMAMAVYIGKTRLIDNHRV